jgi:putative membrane protein
MIVAGLIAAGLAAVVHLYIFVLESLRWTAPRTRAIFGTSEQEAATTKLLAFNQGFYNLFLATITAVGIIAVAIGWTAVGAALVFAGTGAMALAALVLVLSSPDKARAAATQGTFPLLAVVLLAIGLAL